ncbi:molybdate ABC transporter substrate-binding protein [Macrococcus lamae]|uniref:Molybdate ABC transporter substrate-binding protein n=1 Tax=Macrococcus lamae TaxID=198484 RepID=A0A4R6BXB9_9STAP|nr:molybdate ABC transporter substrate-binding protein [Macrococcus lamae]
MCIVLLTGCDSQKTTVTVSAAASLKDALGDIEKYYEKSHPNIDIVYNFGASGTLSNQIKAGAPVDLFFSASVKDMNKLIKNSDISKENTASLLKNRLVLISKKKHISPVHLTDSNIKRIAIGTPETVPAGIYAKSAINKLQLWSKVKNKIIYTKDVRQVLTYVESGNVDAGIVYYTDALPTSLETCAISNQLHEPITYPLGIVSSAKDLKATQDFYHYLQNNQSKKVYRSYGFTVE